MGASWNLLEELCNFVGGGKGLAVERLGKNGIGLLVCAARGQCHLHCRRLAIGLRISVGWVTGRIFDLPMLVLRVRERKREDGSGGIYEMFMSK